MTRILSSVASFALVAVAPFASPAEAQSRDAVLARWRANLPGWTDEWVGAVVTWTPAVAHQTNNRQGYNSRAVYSFGGEPLYPYMGPWADGCEVTVEQGYALIIEWRRGTDVWRETLLGPGDRHVIDLRPGEDGAMIESPNTPETFRVSLANCTPQPVVPSGPAVSISDGLATTAPGTPVAYAIEVTNTNPYALDALALSVSLPAAVLSPSFVPATGSYSPTTGAWTGLSLAPGATASMSAAGTIAAGATGTLTATATAATVAPAAPSSGTASDATTLVGSASADLEITQSGPASVAAGQTVTFVVTVVNRGPSNAVGVVVQDPTPPGLAFVSNAGDCTTPFPCSLGTLPPGAARTIQATYAVPPDYVVP